MPDKDTKEILSEADHVKNMLGSDGWKSIKGKLDAKILDLQMIGNVEGNTPDEKIKDMEARGKAVAIIFEWLKSDVYGFVEQQELNNQRIAKEGDQYIERG